MHSILAPSTLRSYCRAWKIFRHIQEGVLHEVVLLPVSVCSVTMYITYLYSFKEIKASTIRTYLSGIAFVHKLKGLDDPCSNPIVRRLMDKLSSRDDSVDTRLPITRILLGKLVNALNSMMLGTYDTALYKAMFLLAWHACLRVSEFTFAADNPHCLTLGNLQSVKGEKDMVVSYKLLFTSFKHKSGHCPAIELAMDTNNLIMCPVLALKTYIALRGEGQGPLFCWKNGLPVSRTSFSKILKRCLAVVNPQLSGYNTHSFRLGRATQAWEDNMPVEKLVILGRWKSDAFRKYYRPSVVPSV